MVTILNLSQIKIRFRYDHIFAHNPPQPGTTEDINISENKKFPRTVFLDAFLKVTEPKNALIGTSESENAVTGNQ